ncbi:hypothetical protein [Ramlibacter sp. 2FC]|uniref:hypothetical protein n=1 Tax=Ramlibacter sp. 2FC TaxID=2502188 RepID=UPI0010F5C5C9|nr:hypothetical protein [Ramlibacter sp. 2FC]
MKNTLDHIVQYGSRRSGKRRTGDGNEERNDGFLSTKQLRQLRSELQQRRLSNEGSLRRKLARVFRWLGV